MTRHGLKTALRSAIACWLLAGCAVRNGDNAEHALTASSRLHVADAAEESGDKQTALSMYLAAANDSPNDRTVQLRSAEGMARNGKLEEAEGLLTRRLKSDPKDMEVLRTLGAVQVMAGKAALAVQSLSEVLASNPGDVKALVDKAVALDVLKRHDQAQILYRQALALAPGDAAISNDLALSLALSGQPAAGVRILAPFRETAGLPQRIQTNLGIMDAASGHPEDARAMLGTRVSAVDLAVLTQAINGEVGVSP